MRRATGLLVVALLVLGACSSNNKVGSNKILNFKPGNASLSTPTPAPTKAAATAAPRAVATPVSHSVVSTAAPVSRFEIAINGARSSSAFDPPDAHVTKGTVVTWTNRDAQTRSVVADDGAFKSPSIAPGRSWSYTASKSGTFTYHDGTRPYAVARLVVS